jgi:hypothetical protein
MALTRAERGGSRKESTASDGTQVEIVSEVNAEDTEKAKKDAELIVARIQEGQFNTGQRNLSVIIPQVLKSASRVPVVRITNASLAFAALVGSRDSFRAPPRDKQEQPLRAAEQGKVAAGAGADAILGSA